MIVVVCVDSAEGSFHCSVDKEGFPGPVVVPAEQELAPCGYPVWTDHLNFFLILA